MNVPVRRTRPKKVWILPLAFRLGEPAVFLGKENALFLIIN